ncbi:MAG: hypothetical protein KatS3mg111_4250 [Pirellulaceae bacterium]|nr:MAG: hypothetical protein KatS3mg111_4250 [Pirellulaceae bacterium]
MEATLGARRIFGKCAGRLSRLSASLLVGLSCLSSPGAAQTDAPRPADQPPHLWASPRSNASHAAAVPELPSAGTQADRVPLTVVPAGYSVTTPVSLATPELVAWIRRLVHENVPAHYEDNRQWGKQREVWDGLMWRREGWKLETKRRTRLVNSGTWTRYTIDLPQPQENLHLEIDQLAVQPNGDIVFRFSVQAPLDVWGRLSHWVRDVQVVSISAAADAACRLDLAGKVRVRVNPLQLPPEIQLHPHVDAARLTLTHYRVRRISQVGGDFAKYLGTSMKGIVDEKIDDLNAKLVEKINKLLHRNTESLRVSMQDWWRQHAEKTP